jgi:hypothetical protein
MSKLSPRHWEIHILSMIHRKKIKEENKLKKGGRTQSYENSWTQYMVKLHRASDCFCFGDNNNM